MNTNYHNKNGQLTISSIEPQLINRLMIEAGKSLGLQEIDLNDPQATNGVAVQQMTIRLIDHHFLNSFKSLSNLKRFP